MAEQSGGEKTLPASPQKRNRAREEGNVARSQDLSAAVALLAALAAMRYLGAPMFERLVAATRYYFDHAAVLEPGVDSAQSLAIQGLIWLAPIVLPFMLVMLVAGVAASILQVGFLFTTKPITPKLSKLNPLNGLLNFFSLRTFVELVKSVFKVALVLYITWITVRGRLGDYVSLMGLTPLALLPAVAAMVVTLWWRIALAFLALGILDYGFQYWQRERNLMMTVQEAKEELKEYEGDPRIKQRIRQIQRRIAMQRMMAEVPKADVIVTNPTRFAVALRYDMAEMAAPVVVAKGARILAERIRDIAMANDVPIVQKPELARAMYRTVEVGHPVPENLFRTVAEVLAYVYRIDRRTEKIHERSRQWQSAAA